jgi:hypothetical protein
VSESFWQGVQSTLGRTRTHLNNFAQDFYRLLLENNELSPHFLFHFLFYFLSHTIVPFFPHNFTPCSFLFVLIELHNCWDEVGLEQHFQSRRGKDEQQRKTKRTKKRKVKGWWQTRKKKRKKRRRKRIPF